MANRFPSKALCELRSSTDPQPRIRPHGVAVSWKILTQHGHRVVFATPDGKPGDCDPIMLSGIGLDPWSHMRCSAIYVSWASC